MTSDMKDTIERYKSYVELPEPLRREADAGPVVTPAGYTIFSPAAWAQFCEIIGRRDT